MHKPESILENETHWIPWDFEIQTDLLILATKPNLVISNKKRKAAIQWTLLSLQATDWNSKKAKRERQVLGPFLRTKKLWNMRMTVIPIVIGILGTISKSLERRLEEMEIKGRISDHLNYSIVKIGWNTEKGPGDLRFAVIQIPVKNHQLKLVWKTHKK